MAVVVTKGNKVKKIIKTFVYGASGMRKSSFAIEALKLVNEDGRPFRIAYVDTETSSVNNYLDEYEDAGIDLDNLLIVTTNSAKEVIEWLDKLSNDEELYIEDEDMNEELILDADGNPFKADMIILDSISVLQDTVKHGMLKVSEKRTQIRTTKKEMSATEKYVSIENASLELADYGKLNFIGKDINRKMIANTNKHIIVIAREKIEYEKKKINGEWKDIPCGFLPDSFKDSKYEYYTVIRMFYDNEDNAYKAIIDDKDRTGVYNQNEIVEGISILDWQDLITSNKGRKKAKIQKESYTEVIEHDIADAIEAEEKKAVIREQKADREKNKVLTTPEQYVDVMTQYAKTLSPSKKKSIPSKLKNADLPTKPTTDLTVEVLAKMYEVIQTI